MTQKLLNKGNSKTIKGEKLGWITYGMHLAPFNLSGFNVCSCASEGCAEACLNTAGRGRMSNVQNSRIEKTKRFFNDRENFLWQLAKEISNGIKNAERKDMKSCFRLNLTSDLPWENIKLESNGKKLSLLEMFPNTQFYDYTKIPTRMTKFVNGELPSNYHLTFSRSETNNAISLAFLRSLGNVAMVFRNQLPKEYFNTKVIDGDETDLRFLDPKGSIVGLVEKGLAKKDKTGFVIG